MAFTRVVLESRLLSADVSRRLRLKASDRSGSIRRLASFIRAFAIGAYRGTLEACVGLVKATATLTFTGAPTAAQTFVLCGQTFTARASGAVVNEFNIGGTISETAANVAAAILASDNAKVTGSVTATSLLGVVTVTAKVPGAIGNGLVLTESLDNATRVDFAGGSDGTRTSLAAGGAS